MPSLQIVEIWIDSTGQQPPALPPGSTEVEVIDGEAVKLAEDAAGVQQTLVASMALLEAAAAALPGSGG